MLISRMEEHELTELEAYVTTIAASVENELDTLLPAPSTNDESRLFEAMRYSIFAGGKRLRPVLIMATNELLKGKRNRAIRVAAAMEALHTYSLIHDDLPCMDDDTLRRGKPTCHVKFDEATAMLAGDALLPLAFEILSERETHPDSTVRIGLINIFAKASGAEGMVGGQMIDILSENRGKDNALDQGTLARLQRKKTGALFSACCEAAIILNGASRDEHHRLASYARNLGLAFQMMDDVLDEIGDEAQTGKTSHRDKELGKATFATLLGVDGAKQQAEFLCEQAIQFVRPFGEGARILELLARFVAMRCH